MSEKALIVNGLAINYKGVFSFDELYSHISRSAEERGYHKHEKRFEEFVKPSGKDLFIELRPVKTKTAYYALMIKIRMELRNVHDITINVNDMPQTFQEGEINMIFDAWTTTDYQHRWTSGSSPYFYLIKGLFHKYVYRFPLEEGFMGEVASDCRYIYQQTKAHLNLYRYKVK